MLNIKYIRNNELEVKENLKRKGGDPEIITLLLSHDAEYREAETKLQNLLAQRNSTSEIIAECVRNNQDTNDLKLKMGDLKLSIGLLECFVAKLAKTVNDLLLCIPNLLSDDVPLGASEADNVEIRKVGTPRQFDFVVKDHVELGEQMELMDFEAAAKMSGSRHVVLKGQIARLERALGQFMLDFHTENNGYVEVNPPLLVKTDSMVGTGQLPKFTDDLYGTNGDDQHKRWMIPTAEVSVTNMVRESILDASVLPLRYVALTPCFRAEAGASGRDTRGLIRQHQFNKVELVSITDETGEGEHERLLEAAESVLKALNLPYRVVTLCGGDTGFSAAKTHDIEVWIPSQNAYREISSVSDFGDFQARRMDARYKSDGKGTKFVRTFNGSGVAVGRALVAVMENYQNKDGSVTIPDVLIPYMKSSFIA